MKLFFVIYKNICIFNEMFYTPENIKKVHHTFQIGRIYAPLSIKRCIYKRDGEQYASLNGFFI
jgi:hypothetical protein